MTRNTDGSHGATDTPACPLHGQRTSTSGGSPADQVDWAGLPVNLDWAFSQKQRDKVYAQHLRFRRVMPLPRRQDASGLCICEIADLPALNRDTGRSVSGW